MRSGRSASGPGDDGSPAAAAATAAALPAAQSEGHLDPIAISEGYLDGFDGMPPASNSSASYLHGWRAGREAQRYAMTRASPG